VYASLVDTTSIAFRVVLYVIICVNACVHLQKSSKFSKEFWKGKLWSPSYYVGTAGHVSAETIRKYIEEQAIHPPFKKGGLLA